MSDPKDEKSENERGKSKEEVHMNPSDEVQHEQASPEGDAPDFLSELCSLLNRFSRENQSDTPDFILRNYLVDCLHAFDSATNRREEWYGRPGLSDRILAQINLDA